MKYLYLLRHGEAVAGAQDDRARALSAHGVSQAQMIGDYLASTACPPDLVLCSPARRTRQTWENLRVHLPNQTVRMHIEDGLYNAMPGDLFDIIARTPPDSGALLVIGHNPGLSMLAGILSDDPRLVKGFSPATLGVFTCENLDDWADIQPGIWACADLIRPA